MTQLLELGQLAHGDGMPQVQVWFGWVVSAVHSEWASFLLRLDQALSQLIFHSLLQGFITIFGSLHEVFHLLIDAHFCFVHSRLHFLFPAGTMFPVSLI